MLIVKNMLKNFETFRILVFRTICIFCFVDIVSYILQNVFTQSLLFIVLSGN